MSAVYATPVNQIATLKELYADDRDYLKDLVYKENPFLALVPKNESPDGMSGKYLPVPIEYGVPQGRSHTFSTAQANQTATQTESFFVYRVSDYQVVSITNELLESTKTNAAAFIDSAKLMMDGGFRNATNNIAFELFSDGTGTRGQIAATGYSFSNPTATITLSNANDIVNFEKGMTLRANTTRGGAVSDDTGYVATVNRATGVMTLTMSDSSPDSEWANSAYLSVDGDVPTAGATTIATCLCLSGLLAWIPTTSPTSTLFWGVDRSSDPTRLGGCRFNASAYTIEEGITNALAFLNREGGKPDLCIMDFASYANLVNSLGAKVQYVQVNHDEVDVAFEGIRFQSAYGTVNVLADRSCPAQTAFLLTMNTWKLRSTGKVPHILTYGVEGLEGLRIGNADALEIRIGHYSNLICSAPGWNCVVTLSA